MPWLREALEIWWLALDSVTKLQSDPHLEGRDSQKSPGRVIGLATAWAWNDKFCWVFFSFLPLHFVRNRCQWHGDFYVTFEGADITAWMLQTSLSRCKLSLTEAQFMAKRGSALFSAVQMQTLHSCLSLFLPLNWNETETLLGSLPCSYVTSVQIVHPVFSHLHVVGWFHRH